MPLSFLRTDLWKENKQVSGEKYLRRQGEREEPSEHTLVLGSQEESLKNGQCVWPFIRDTRMRTVKDSLDWVAEVSGDLL